MGTLTVFTESQFSEISEDSLRRRRRRGRSQSHNLKVGGLHSPAANSIKEGGGLVQHRLIATAGSAVRTALALLAIDLYAARDVVGHRDRSWCLTLAGTPFESGTPPRDGVATDGQVGREPAVCGEVDGGDVPARPMERDGAAERSRRCPSRTTDSLECAVKGSLVRRRGTAGERHTRTECCECREDGQWGPTNGTLRFDHCDHSFRATSGPVIRSRMGNVAAMIAIDAASPPITVVQ